MSLINDALRRASQTQKDRPNQAPLPVGMVAVSGGSKSSVNTILIAVVVVALALAGWFFHQWWTMRKNLNTAHAPAPAVAMAAEPAPAPAPVPVAVVKPAPVAPVVPVVVTPKPAPAPAPAPVVASAAPVVTPSYAPAVVPVAAAVTETPIAWPTGLKISAIFFSRTNPRAMVNGNIYGVGDQIEGATVQRIGKDKIILEMNGHTKDLNLEGQ